MIVNVCGFGWSGSGAFLDLLHEYEETTFPTNEDWEFNFLWAPDGLYDLEQKLCVKHCRIYESDLAINRFLSIAKVYGERYKYNKVFGIDFYDACNTYIKQLIQFELDANCFIHELHPTNKDMIIKFYHRFLYHIFARKYTHLFDTLYYKLRVDNLKHMRVSYNPANYLEITQNFLGHLLDLLKKEKDKILVLNQSVPPDMPTLCNHFFKESHKTIVVRRDPRDTFILINELCGKNKPVPKDVDNFIEFYKKTIAETKLNDNESLLSIQFEDLVYNYENIKAKVEVFLGINNQVHKLEYFNPLKSKNNTQLIELYPQYLPDIKKIEKELPQYLFCYDGLSFDRDDCRIF